MLFVRGTLCQGTASAVPLRLFIAVIPSGLQPARNLHLRLFQQPVRHAGWMNLTLGRYCRWCSQTNADRDPPSIRNLRSSICNRKARHRGARCTRKSLLPLLPSGPGGIRKNASRGTRRPDIPILPSAWRAGVPAGHKPAPRSSLGENQAPLPLCPLRSAFLNF